MAGVAVCCLFFSVWAWGGDAMTFAPEFFLAIGACLILAGVILRRYILIVASAVLLVALSLALYDHYRRLQQSNAIAQTYAWRRQVVTLRVIDSATKKPVVGASVRVVSGDGYRTEVSNACTGASGTSDVSAWLIYTRFVHGVGRSLCKSFTKVEVRAAGYEPSCTPFSAFPVGEKTLYGFNRDYYSDSVGPPLVVQLRRE